MGSIPRRGPIRVPEGIVYEKDVEMGYVTEIDPVAEEQGYEWVKPSQNNVTTVDNSINPDDVVRNECYISSSGGENRNVPATPSTD